MITSPDSSLLKMHRNVEMEMKKLHMGTMSFGHDSMDEVVHQLVVAFGALGENCA